MKPEAERVLRSFPAVRTWLQQQKDQLTTEDADSIKRDISQLVGESASDAIFESLHIPAEERAFLRTKEAHDAILEAISDAISV